MLGALTFVLGLAALLLLVVDAGWTTLWPDRSGGPVSSRILIWSWRHAPEAVRRRHLWLSALGPAAISLVLLFWVGLLWVGWVLVFVADPASVINSTTRAPASAGDVLYFVGFTVFTLGVGDFAPNGLMWQLLTVMASASGLILVSIGITYLVSVLGAAVNKRAFASRVHSMGRTPEEFVINSWAGSFAGIELLLSSLAADLSRLGAQHLAYPVIHFYHPVRRDMSSAAAVALLAEAIMLLADGVAEQERPSGAILHSGRRSVESYLALLEGGTVEPAESPPPPPQLAQLSEAGIPTVEDARFVLAAEAQADRRRLLLGLVRSEYWNWTPDRAG